VRTVDGVDLALTFAVALALVAVGAAIAEIFVGSFFLAPIAAGAGAGSLVGFFGMSPGVQIGVAIAVTAVSFALLAPLSKRINADTPDTRVGENRLIGASGVALTELGPGEPGLARIEREEWRAESTETITAGTPLTVTGVLGTRVLVTPDTTTGDTP
jgi:membrane-bound serine protease (ClpP class)